MSVVPTRLVYYQNGLQFSMLKLYLTTCTSIKIHITNRMGKIKGLYNKLLRDWSLFTGMGDRLRGCLYLGGRVPQKGGRMCPWFCDTHHPRSMCYMWFCDTHTPQCATWFCTPSLHIMVLHLWQTDHVHTYSNKYYYNKQENYLLDKNGSI